ncbi:hypothetical protein MLD38_040547 [Melastoma candidum]|nr:hypothetical protein MLD38_040547 [Melastoma candidum]
MAAGTCSASPWHPPHDVVSLSSSPGGSTHPCSDGNRVGNNSEREADDQDLISQLPNSIIGEIFSFLTMEEIVKTSVLSRLWRSKWTGTRTISFSPSAQDRRCKLRSFRTPWIDRVLARCTALAILKLHVSFGYAPSMKGSVDGYVGFAVARGVKDMELNLSPKDVFREPRDRYFVLGILLSYRSIERLHLGYCSLKAVQDDGVDWRSLRALCIDKTRLEGGLLDKILTGCPVLERLELKSCYMRSITILSTKVRHLVIDGLESGTTLEIYAPYLLSLRIQGESHRGPFLKLNEVTPLVDVELDVQQKIKVIMELLTQLRGIHMLHSERLYFRQLTLLMKGHAERLDLYGIVTALRGAPVMEKLVLNLAQKTVQDNWLHRPTFSRCPFEKSNGEAADCLKTHLKSIEIFGHDVEADTDWKTWLPLVEFLL